MLKLLVQVLGSVICFEVGIVIILLLLICIDFIIDIIKEGNITKQLQKLSKKDEV